MDVRSWSQSLAARRIRDRTTAERPAGHPRCPAGAGRRGPPRKSPSPVAMRAGHTTAIRCRWGDVEPDAPGARPRRLSAVVRSAASGRAARRRDARRSDPADRARARTAYSPTGSRHPGSARREPPRRNDRETCSVTRRCRRPRGYAPLGRNSVKVVDVRISDSLEARHGQRRRTLLSPRDLTTRKSGHSRLPASS